MPLQQCCHFGHVIDGLNKDVCQFLLPTCNWKVLLASSTLDGLTSVFISHPFSKDVTGLGEVSLFV